MQRLFSPCRPTDGGVADDALLRRAIEVKAKWYGLSFDEAVDAALDDRLPKDGDGTCLQVHIEMLLATA